MYQDATGEFCEVILRTSPFGGSRKFDKSFLHNSSLMASMRLLCNEQGGASLRVPPLCGKEAFDSKTLSENRQVEQDVSTGKLNERHPVFSLLRPASA